MEETTEEWRKIDPPFENYSVSSFGRVRNDKTDYVFNRMVHSEATPYLIVSLRAGGQSKGKLVHVLVAQQFLGYSEEMQKDKALCVHHVDGDKSNAHLGNLEVITVSQNNTYAAKNKRQRRTRPVLQFTLEGEFVAEYPSAKDINPLWKQHIWKCCMGKQDKAYGYAWRYKDDPDMDGELWKDAEVDGMSFKVSDYGRVDILGRLKTYGSKRTGYSVIGINGTLIPVHRLVCTAFNPCDGYELLFVNHIDGDKLNNEATNLEWVSKSQNSKSYHSTKTTPERNWRRFPVVRIAKDGSTKEYASAKKASQDVGLVHQGGIIDCCKKHGHQSTSGGYGWMYLKDYAQSQKERQQFCEAVHTQEVDVDRERSLQMPICHSIEWLKLDEVWSEEE